ncbi:MAG: T9SS type A sorting domain-containing protein [Bacteroidales bacterium]|nr:T9SS type A sorting domain-containing protein [Bacteroidales bacterium]
MRRKVFFIAFALLLATAAQAQQRAVLLHETFDGLEMPEGWTLSGLGLNQWSVSGTALSGGFANEMTLTWSPQFNGTSRLVTPPVDLTGVGSVMFSFKHFLDSYHGHSNPIGIATSSDGGNTWNEVWRQNYGATGAYQVRVEVQNADMGQPSVLFCIFFTGDSSKINNWYFDDVEVYTVENFDLGITSLTLPALIPIDAKKVGMKVFNYGQTPITSIEAQYEIAGQMPVTETFAVNIASEETETLEFAKPAVVEPGNHDVTVRLLSVNGGNDQFSGNDMLTKTVTFAIGSAERKAMIENFSSSTCGPCVETNIHLQELCARYPDMWTFSKFSTIGDAYYNQDCSARSNYYHIVAVPQHYLDGENRGYDPIADSIFLEHCNRYAYMDIRGSFVIDGTTITVKADIMPYIDEEATVYITVNEKMTTGNVGYNGEREFYHVVMKSLPSSNGTPLTFTAGENQYLEYEFNLSSTHVEEYDDLEVAIWVQKNTKEILNSRYAYEYSEVHPYPVENLVLFEEARDRMLRASWDAPSQGSPLGYNVYVNGELALENTTELTYAFPAEADKYNVVEVQAVYPDGLTSVKRVAGLMNYDAVTEQEAYSCRVYPNPANTQVRIEAESDINVVKVYDVLGNLVQTFSANGNALNVSLSRFSNGVYLFNVMESNGKVSCQRVVVTH